MQLRRTLLVIGPAFVLATVGMTAAAPGQAFAGTGGGGGI